MQISWLDAGKVFAIQLLFGTTFFLSAALKWSGGMPAWFVQQFQETWLAQAPGGLPAVFYFLAVLAYGARLTGEFDVAAYNLMYFVGALLCLREISPETRALS